MQPDWKMVGFIPAANAEASRRFFESALGMRFVQDDGFAVVMDAGGILVRLVRMGAEFRPLPYTILGWEVPDIEVAVDRLRQAGVALERFGLPGQGDNGVWNAPGGSRIAWFKDPCGNVLSVSQHV